MPTAPDTEAGQRGRQLWNPGWSLGFFGAVPACVLTHAVSITWPEGAGSPPEGEAGEETGLCPSL